MKKSLHFLGLLIFCTIIPVAGALAQCPTGQIDFSSQAQIDAFPANYPGCTYMPFTIDISGANITNLNGLSQLTALGGNLKIHGNTLLSNLAGLENIQSAVAGLDIYDNPALTSIAALSGITSAGGSLRVENNPLLTSLAGLEGLSAVGGGISISTNPLLNNLNGLNNVTAVGGSLSITSNAALSSLSGLGSLGSVGISFTIISNPSLSSLATLSNLTEIGGPLTVSNNAALASLSGLDNINSGSITLVNLLTNNSLYYCSVTSICNYLAVPTNPANIVDNLNGCNSRAQVQAACTALPIELRSFEVKIQENGCLLQWQTASELNNSRFEVEYSRNNVSFEKIGVVYGQGNSTIPHDYTFLHRTPMPGANYYRLKQCDLDGNFRYSSVIIAVTTNNQAVCIVPNPVTKGCFRVSFGKSSVENRTLHILQIDGRVRRIQSVPGDVAEQFIHVEDLEAGLYLLQITDENGIIFRQKVQLY